MNRNSLPSSGQLGDNRRFEIASNMEPIPGPSREYHGGDQRRDVRAEPSNKPRLNSGRLERMKTSPR